MSFDQAFRFAMKWEGGSTLTNDPDDPGGLTKYGISKRAHPDLDIENLTEEEAKKVYYRDYWLSGQCDGLPFPLNIVHFDACVNTGTRRAAMFLQRALGVPVDGVIGPITLKSANEQDSIVSSKEAVNERNEYYRELTRQRPVMGKYINGWLNRTTDLLREINRPAVG